ncbi:hypothetical protein [Rhizohabitans arisaemae]|uniref:hypothetical protein n=1 Tax=Rhizohabitans arisaemae TaxID=2720610 RepID=UPI0024B21CF0|nr:hypothetical protein [Rhizohabitans arisaemae]
MRRGAIAAALCVALAACSVVSRPQVGGTGPAPPSATVADRGGPQPAVAEAEAERIARRYLEVAGEADLRRDQRLLAQVEGGTALAVHSALYRILPRPGRIPGDVTDRFLIPKFTGYPRWFVAEGRGHAAVFVRRSPGAPWLVRHRVTLQGPLPRVKRDRDGYAVQPREVPDPAVDHAQLITRGGCGDLCTALRRHHRLFAGARWRARVQIRPGQERYALRTADGGSLVWYFLDHSFTAVRGEGGHPVTMEQEAARMLGVAELTRRMDWRSSYQAVAHAGRGRTLWLGLELPGWVSVTGR